jgi:predicted acylesterase/phospholipase RssA
MSIGAVQVLTGNMQYFDTASHTIGPEHVMASGALPPGFPPIEINGEPYWDGGLVSNAPLEYVLDPPREDMVIFQIDLFSAKGCIPKTLFDLTQREKEIRYSSRTYRYLPRAANHPQDYPSLAEEGAARASRQSRLAIPRQRELRCRDHDRTAHSPARSLLDAI